MEKTLTEVQELIKQECDSICELLIEKNRKYGNSAIYPSQIFSKSNSLEQIRVRMDDKLNRIKNMQPDDMEDPLLDLIGYAILYRVTESLNK